MEIGQWDNRAGSGRIRFGVFEADPESKELRRSGLKVRIQSQPFKVLLMLLERPGEVVSREEIRNRLWGEETTVDFDHGLGTAINKLREALGDAAENPRFVETLSKRGYRFIAPVHRDGSGSEEEPGVGSAGEAAGIVTSGVTPAIGQQEALPVDAAAVTYIERGGSKRVRQMPASAAWIAIAVAIVMALVAGVGWLRAGAPATPVEVEQITFTGRVSPGEPLQEDFGVSVTDGSRMYFTQMENGTGVLAESLIADGETSVFPAPSEIGEPTIADISPDGSELLIRNRQVPLAEQALWIKPTLGETARLVGNVQAHDATWMPDGHRILYASGTELFISDEEGTQAVKFATLPGRAFWLRWAPDGSELRFTMIDPLSHATSLWAISASGKKLRELLPGWSRPAAECCGNWSADGRYYVFQSSHTGLSNLWALDKPGLIPWVRGPRLVQLTNGPLSYRAPVTSRTGHKVLFTGLDTRSVLLEFSAGTKQFERYAKGLGPAELVEFSRDGRWVAWIRTSDSTLWRSRADGSQKLQLTLMKTFMMHWSPDGKKIALMGREPEGLWKIYEVSANGGEPQAVVNEDRNQADPDWSPDGQTLVYGRVPELMGEKSREKGICLVDMKSRKVTEIAGSEGLFSPRWSPDGRYIAALPLDQQKLMLYDTREKTWRVLMDRPSHDPVWSHDGKWIYVHDFLADDQPVYRVSVPDGSIEQVAGMSSLKPLDVVNFRFSGLAPGDVPLVSARLSTANIYSLDLDAR